MKIIKNICTNSDCYKRGKTIKVKGLMLHSVGCPQPKASVFIKNWNKPGESACVHAIVGSGGKVYQTLPWNHRGWHCGGDGNNTHIGVEMCEPACITYTHVSSFTCSDMEKAKDFAKRTYEIAVELFAMLCVKYNLNPTADGVILSHREGYVCGIASNHGDPEHLWTQLGLEYTMDTFRKAVKAKIGNSSDCPFTVRVAITDLNIRKGAGTNSDKTGKCTGIGTFAIVEVKNGEGSNSGWGRLKSGAGWISLDYCTRV